MVGLRTFPYGWTLCADWWCSPETESVRQTSFKLQSCSILSRSRDRCWRHHCTWTFNQTVTAIERLEYISFVRGVSWNMEFDYVDSMTWCSRLWLYGERKVTFWASYPIVSCYVENIMPDLSLFMMLWCQAACIIQYASWLREILTFHPDVSNDHVMLYCRLACLYPIHSHHIMSIHNSSITLSMLVMKNWLFAKVISTFHRLRLYHYTLYGKKWHCLVLVHSVWYSLVFPIIKFGYIFSLSSKI